jgi:hypothetical protein
MQAGASFNVLVVQKPSADVFVQTATSGNITAAATYINSIATNGKASTQLLITPNDDPGGKNGDFDNHVVGAAYSTSQKKWGIVNEDEATMKAGLHFIQRHGWIDHEQWGQRDPAANDLQQQRR